MQRRLFSVWVCSGSGGSRDCWFWGKGCFSHVLLFPAGGMAKRIADKELTDRNWDQEEEGEEVSGNRPLPAGPARNRTH